MLGESSNDLATLCKSEKINIWSKYKPISCKGEFKEYPTVEDSHETVTSSYNKYNCDIRCGMNIPIDTYKNLYNNYGGEGFAIKACNNFYKDNVYGFTGIDKDASTNSHTIYASGKHFPKGGTNSPYRLGDFRNYNNEAISNRFRTSLPLRPQQYKIRNKTGIIKWRFGTSGEKWQQSTCRKKLVSSSFEKMYGMYLGSFGSSFVG